VGGSKQDVDGRDKPGHDSGKWFNVIEIRTMAGPGLQTRCRTGHVRSDQHPARRESERTPRLRILPTVIGRIGSSEADVAHSIGQQYQNHAARLPTALVIVK